PIVRGRATPSRTLQVRSRSAVVAHGRSRLIRRSGPPYGRSQDAGVIEVVKQTDTDGSRIGDGFPGNDPSTIEVALCECRLDEPAHRGNNQSQAVPRRNLARHKGETLEVVPKRLLRRDEPWSPQPLAITRPDRIRRQLDATPVQTDLMNRHINIRVGTIDGDPRRQLKKATDLSGL